MENLLAVLFKSNLTSWAYGLIADLHLLLQLGNLEALMAPIFEAISKLLIFVPLLIYYFVRSAIDAEDENFLVESVHFVVIY